MNARQWLGRARTIDREIAALEENLQKARDAAQRITQNYEGNDGVQSTKDPHKLDRIVEYADFIREKLDESYAVKKEIAEVILQIQDNRYRTALLQYYVNGVSWEEVASSMHYSWRWTMRLRKAALKEAEKAIESHIGSVV